MIEALSHRYTGVSTYTRPSLHEMSAVWHAYLVMQKSTESVVQEGQVPNPPTVQKGKTNKKKMDGRNKTLGENTL